MGHRYQAPMRAIRSGFLFQTMGSLRRNGKARREKNSWSNSPSTNLEQSAQVSHSVNRFERVFSTRTFEIWAWECCFLFFSVLLFLLPSPGAPILVRVFRSNFFDGTQLEKRFLVLWAANVFFDSNEVVEVDN